MAAGTVKCVFDGRFREAVEDGVAPVGSSLGSRRLKADHFTLVGLVLAAACAGVIASGHLLIGLVLLVLAAVPDLLDGAVAKATGTASVRGAFFDSVSDRVTDSLILGGIAWHLASAESPHWAVLPLAVLGVSNLISYERAKAESLGFEAKGGLMERAERIIALCVGLAFPVALVPVLCVMLALTSVTAIQRFVKVWRQAPGPGAVEVDSAAELLRRERAERAAARATEQTSRWREWREARVPGSRPVSWPRSHWRERPGPVRQPRGPWGRRDRTRP